METAVKLPKSGRVTPVTRKIIKNFFSLSIIQMADIILPLITFPYLVRVLGSEKYGAIIFARSFVEYFSTLVGFGFHFTATKDISVNRNDSKKLGFIVGSVLLLKLMLFLLSTAILVFLLFAVESYGKQRTIILFEYGMVIYTLLFPVWFFQGIEDMKFIMYLKLSAKILYLLGILSIVKNADDFFLVPAINSILMIIIGLAGLVIVFRQYKIKPTIDIPQAWTLLKRSFYFYISRLSINVFTATNAVLLGTMSTMSNVAYYGVAAKILALLKNPFMIANNVIFPHMAHSKNISHIKKSLKLFSLAGLLIYIVIFFSADLIIRILAGEEFLYAATILRITSLTVPLVSIHYFLGSSTLVALGHEKHFNNSVILGALCYLLAIWVLNIFKSINIISLSIVLVFIEVAVLVYRGYIVYSKKLLSGENTT